MHASIHNRAKEIEVEDGQLKKMCAEEGLKAEIVKAVIRFWWAQPRPIPGTGRFSSDLEELSDAEGELLEAVKAYRAQWKNLQTEKKGGERDE